MNAARVPGVQRDTRGKIGVFRDIRLYWNRKSWAFWRALGLVLTALAQVCFSLMFYYYFSRIVPAYEWSSVFYSWPGNLVTALGVFIYLNIVYNHLAACMRCPGYAELSPPENIHELIAAETTKPPVFGWKKNCPECIRPKPPRAHHCTVCKKCVYRFDHHCPWVNNCIGLYNYHHFVILLFWLATGCLFITLLVMPIIFPHHFGFWIPISQSISDHLLADGLFKFGAWLCVMTLGPSSALLGSHLSQILTNRTAPELREYPRIKRYLARSNIPFRNPYDAGWRKNIESVFGKQKHFILNFFPIVNDIRAYLNPELNLRPGDGINYETPSDDVQIDALAAAAANAASSTFTSGGTTAVNQDTTRRMVAVPEYSDSDISESDLSASILRPLSSTTASQGLDGNMAASDPTEMTSVVVDSKYRRPDESTTSLTRISEALSSRERMFQERAQQDVAYARHWQWIQAQRYLQYARTQQLDTSSSSSHVSGE